VRRDVFKTQNEQIFVWGWKYYRMCVYTVCVCVCVCVCVSVGGGEVGRKGGFYSLNLSVSHFMTRELVLLQCIHNN